MTPPAPMVAPPVGLGGYRTLNYYGFGIVVFMYEVNIYKHSTFMTHV